MITKHADKSANLITDTRLFESARKAWGYLLKTLTPNRILLPAYIGFTDREGSGVMDPVLEQGVPFDFYPLDKCLQPDLKDIEQLLATKQYQLLLAIHYFGYVRIDMAELKRICKKYDVVLVEDCAHAFQLGLIDKSAGVWGDYSFYSIHKHLPTKVGGLLCCNPEGPQLPASEDRCDHCLRNVANILLGADLIAISDKRRQNANFLIERIQQGPAGFHLLYNEVPLVPQTLPIMVDDIEREALYFRLMDLGVPTTALYYRLHESIDADKFSISHDISRRILNLPIHQDMEADDLKGLYACLVKCAKDLRQ